MERKKVTVPGIIAMKRKGKRIAMLSIYDYPTARLADRAGVDIILVGDTLGMVILGYETTLPVTTQPTANGLNGQPFLDVESTL